MRPRLPTGAIRHLRTPSPDTATSAPTPGRSSASAAASGPVRMEGHRARRPRRDRTRSSGEIARHATFPAGQLLIRCNNRRATRCAACAEIYRKRHLPPRHAPDCSGGKGIGPAVAATPPRLRHLHRPLLRPRPQPPRRRPLPLRHALHPDDDPALGTPLDPDRYDYRAAVLWNAHAGSPVGPLHHLPAPASSPPARASPARELRRLRSRSRTPRSPSTRGAAPSTSTP